MTLFLFQGGVGGLGGALVPMLLIFGVFYLLLIRPQQKKQRQLQATIAELKAGEAAALAKFNNKDGSFRDRDLYVFCYSTSDGKFSAHPNPALMGTDIRALKVNDDPLGQRIFDTAKAGSVLTVAYNFPKPGTTQPVPKESYVTVVGSQGCGVGYYK